MARSRILLVLGSLLMMVAGPVACSGGGGGAGTSTARPTRAARDTGPAEPIIEEVDEEEEPGTRYSYNSIGKRDPFRSFIQKEVIVVGDGGPLGPLQLHEIDAYALRGIIWNIQGPRALVEAPDGQGHVAELGTLIGKNWGKITQIKPDEIIITEEYRDPIENELIINEITMRLPDPADEL
jgi:type IV pilus assembly protein PilP